MRNANIYTAIFEMLQLIHNENLLIMSALNKNNILQTSITNADKEFDEIMKRAGILYE